MKILKNKIFLLFFFLLTALLLSISYQIRSDYSIVTISDTNDSGSPSKSSKWIIFKSSHFTVYCNPTANLKRIERKLRKRKFYITGLKNSDYSRNIQDKIGYRLDRLFVRAKQILDMNPRIKKIHLKIFKNRKEVKEEFFKIYRIRRRVKSFYVYKFNTIFISEQDITDSVVAHEIGHALTDHYFVVIPPLKVREMLASYVDLHLEEERILVE
ncbi:MAG: hypothetical protein KAI43_09670 [Candidatus Aureabacteria bacterium]|nr:hypothetical protein [Candidatus Auribacterota bacterium]